MRKALLILFTILLLLGYSLSLSQIVHPPENPQHFKGKDNSQNDDDKDDKMVVMKMVVMIDSGGDEDGGDDSGGDR